MDTLNQFVDSKGRIYRQGEFLEGYQYRETISIDNSSNSNTLLNYQVKVTIDHEALVDASKSNADGSDLRFTDNDEVSLLPFWVESGLDSASCIIWVRIPYIPPSTTKTIYLYYDPGTKEDLSNGADAFDFFDDFEGNDIDTLVWGDEGTYTISNSILQITLGSVRMLNPLPFDLNDGYMTEGRIQYPTQASLLSGSLTVSSSYFTASSNTNSDATILYMRTPGSYNVNIWAGDGSTASFNKLSSILVFTSVDDTWYIMGDETTPTTLAVWKDYSRENNSGVTWSKDINYIRLGAWHVDESYNIQDTWYDWVRARKYSSPEPSGSEVSEETQLLKTSTAKGRIFIGDITNTSTAKGRIEKEEENTIQAKAWLNYAHIVQAKANILNRLDVVSLDSIILPIPSESRIVPLYKWGKHDSIGGKDRREKYGMKHRFEIRWRFMKKGAYESLENIVNSGDPVTLKYERYPQSADGTSVLVKLGERTHVALVGTNNFYSDVTITAIETETT